MPAEVLGLIAAGIVAAVVVTVLLTRRQVTGRLRRQLDVAADDDLGRVVREMRGEAAAAREDSARARGDLSQIGELLETGVVHIAADLRVTDLTARLVAA